MSWKHSDGSLRTNNYIVPHANQCKSCHMSTEKTFLPLGPKARNLNKEFAYHGGKENQLTHWTQIGAPRVPPEPEKLRAVRVRRSDHRLGGAAGSRVARRQLRATATTRTARPDDGARPELSQNNPAKIGVFKSPVAAGHGSGENKFDIVPGKPEESIVLYRLESTEPGVMMPELPRRLRP